MREVLGCKREGEAGRQQQARHVDADHGQDDDEGSQQRAALRGCNDGARDARVQGSLSSEPAFFKAIQKWLFAAHQDRQQDRP